MNFRSIHIIMLALLVSGCASQLPIASNYPISSQKKVRSAHHWDVIADDVANQTIIASNGKLHGFAKQPIFVQAPPENTPFNKAFRNFLITRMVNRGIEVRNSKQGAVEIQYELQLVRHGSNRYTHIPGTLTALTAGISVLRDVLASSSSAIPTSLGLSAVSDWGLGYYGGGATKNELIVTTSIIRDGAYALRKSDVYYIEDADTSLFVEALERPVKQWHVVGK